MNDQEFSQSIEKYADVIIKVGLRLRKGQRLLVAGAIENAPLIRQVTKAAYQAGAQYVDVLYGDERIERIRFEYADPGSITEVPEWPINRLEEYERRGDARLFIASNDPDLLAGIDPGLIAKNRKAFMEKRERLRQYENVANWCVVAGAAPAWAKKVFPDLAGEEAEAKLWEAIFNACRIDVPDPVTAWQMHAERLLKYRDYLNAKAYSALHYNGPGTDLTVGLPEKQRWNAAQDTFKNGVTSTVNIPTEEVFGAPHREKAEGVVSASLPLNLGGIMVEEFSLTFEGGRAVKVTAKAGEDDLRKLIEMDENAARLGEVALVPHSSPISQRGILFYSTLFDENAASHIALGNAYRVSFRGGEDMTDEEFAAAGGNKSLIHVDFMVGSDTLDIDGICADGSREAIMRGGEWAFEV